VFVKGQSKTGLYRFMAKNGGYVWVDTEIAMIGDVHSERSRSILCINHVVRWVCIHALLKLFC
jgi:hypothetical protein